MINKSIIIGEYADLSGMSDVAYGPFEEKRATEIAEELTDGGWKEMNWKAVPLDRLPGEPVPVKGKTMEEMIAEKQANPLFKVLDQRQGDDEAEGRTPSDVEKSWAEHMDPSKQVPFSVPES